MVLLERACTGVCGFDVGMVNLFCKFSMGNYDNDKQSFYSS